MRPSTLPAAALLAATLVLGGCGLMKEKPYTPSEAEKKLAAFCLKEGSLQVVTRRVDNTLWIYAPLKVSLFEMKASPDRGKTERTVQPLALLSLQAEYSQRYFKFNYDVVPNVLSGEPVTYGSAYNEEYTKKRHLIYQAVQESLFSATATPANPLPEFIVILVADITKGIATRSTLYLDDLKKSLTEAIPPDEYYMRELNDIIGKETLIDDTLGRAVPYAPVGWTYFLTEQIKNRIKYKFTASDFPPKDAPADAIAALAANTLRLYPFTDYDGVMLYAVREKQELVLGKEKLKTYTEKAAWEEPGKVTTIHFELPRDASGEMTVKSAEPKTTE